MARSLYNNMLVQAMQIKHGQVHVNPIFLE